MGCGSLFASLSMNYYNISDYIDKIVCLNPSVYPTMSLFNKSLLPLIKLIPILKSLNIYAIPNFPKYFAIWLSMIC